jgi:hypothetical protein
MLYGRPVILQEAAAVRQLLLFANTLSNNEHQTKGIDTSCPRYSSPP